MIRLLVATIALIAVIGSVAFAQDSTPKVQVFGGSSYVHVDTGGLTGADLDFALHEVKLPFRSASNFTGGNAEGRYNFNRWIGLAAGAMACPLRVRETTSSKDFPRLLPTTVPA
jgi:hypothetical protein